MKQARVSNNVIRRLPRYLRKLDELRSAGVDRISSGELGRQMGLTSSQIRQDFSCFGEFGQQGYGYNVTALRGEIASILGMDRHFSAVLVGVGGLGSALAGYGGFKSYGLNIVAAFDTDPARIGKEVGGVRVYGADVLSQTVREKKVRIGVIAVPKQAAQAAADALVEGGVRAIWNFAPVHLALPADIAVKNEDMAASLAILSRRLAEILKNEK